MTAIVLVILLAVAVGVLLGWLARGYHDAKRLVPAIKHATARTRIALDGPVSKTGQQRERLGLAIGKANANAIIQAKGTK